MITCREFFEKFYPEQMKVYSPVSVCLRYTEQYTEPGDGTDRNWFPVKASEKFWHEHYIACYMDMLNPPTFHK